MQLKVAPLSQVFIEVLLLTPVFHKVLSFMAVGHDPVCVSKVTLAAGGSSPQVFKKPFHASFGDLIFSFFRYLISFCKDFFIPLMTLKEKKKN